MKLHLGCGQRYLDGYLNVDFPMENHSVQQVSRADLCVDLFTLRYEPESIDEVRLHHVFEHFDRAEACALLTTWHIWLRPSGILHIEVPDFHRTAKSVLSIFSSRQKKLVGLRHLFGSHEADWASHREGYTAEILEHFFHKYGFESTSISRNSWKNTYNIEIVGRKTRELSPRDLEIITERYLSDFLLNKEAESRMLSVWMAEYKKKLQAMISQGKDL